MKKVFLLLSFLFLSSFSLFASDSSVHYYIGEMYRHQPNEEYSRHYGLFFLKHTLIPEENRFIDFCFLDSPEDGCLELEQISTLKGDSNQTVVSSTDGFITGSGELVGFPWKWTNIKERMQLSNDNPISIEVENQMDDDYILSIVNVYYKDSRGEKELLAILQSSTKSIKRF